MSGAAAADATALADRAEEAATTLTGGTDEATTPGKNRATAFGGDTSTGSDAAETFVDDAAFLSGGFGID